MSLYRPLFSFSEKTKLFYLKQFNSFATLPANSITVGVNRVVVETLGHNMHAPSFEQYLLVRGSDL